MIILSSITISFMTIIVNIFTYHLFLKNKISMFKIGFVFLCFFLMLLFCGYYMNSTLLKIIRPYIAILFLPLFIFLFEGLLYQKIFLFFVQILSTTCIYSVSAIASQIIVPYGTATYSFITLFLILVSYLIYIFIIYKYAKLILNKILEFTKAQTWKIYSIAVITIYIVLIYLRFSNGLSYEIQDIGSQIIITFFTIWSLCIFFIAIVHNNEKSLSNFELNFTKNVLSNEKDYYESLNSTLETIRIMRHDYKYQLNTLNELLETNKKEDAYDFLSNIMTKSSLSDLPLFCTNQVINALIASYYKQFFEYEIKFTVNIIMPKKIAIDNYELCIIFGNLLQNAEDACLKLQADKHRQIEFSVKEQNSQLAIMVKNNFNGIAIKTNDKLESTKQNGGLGINSIKAILNKYNGELISDWKDDEFTSYVLINI